MSRERCAGWAAAEEQLAGFLRLVDKNLAEGGQPHAYMRDASGELAAAARRAIEANARFRAAAQEYRRHAEDLAYQLRVCAR